MGNSSVAKASVLKRIGGLTPLVMFLFCQGSSAAPEPTTPASPFSLDSPTPPTVTAYSPLIGDNELFPSTTASIYNLFGASNTSVEDAGHVIFGDRNSQPNTVNFETPTPVSLIGVAVYLDSDDGTLNGPRSVGTFTFTAGGVQVLSTAPVNESIADHNGLNIFMFSNVVTASSFVATFSSNPNLNFTPDSNNDGVGPRVYELDGIAVPEPASFVVLAMSIGALGLLARHRRARCPARCPAQG